MGVVTQVTQDVWLARSREDVAVSLAESVSEALQPESLFVLHLDPKMGRPYFEADRRLLVAVAQAAALALERLREPLSGWSSNTLEPPSPAAAPVT